MLQKKELLNKISANIIRYGYHVTVVTGGELPRFAYTIGCKDNLNVEFIFAGSENYSYNDISEIFNKIILLIKSEVDWGKLSLDLGHLGYFSIVKADISWSKLMLLGAFDYYNQTDIQTWQILPDQKHSTLDIPDMTRAFDSVSQPVWQWLSKEWNYPVPSDSTVVTDLKVLFGEKATEVMRWEKDEWEIFSEAPDDIPATDKRMIPLGVLIGIDESLKISIYLDIGKGYWRDKVELEWNNWG